MESPCHVAWPPPVTNRAGEAIADVLPRVALAAVKTHPPDGAVHGPQQFPDERWRMWALPVAAAKLLPRLCTEALLLFVG